MNGFPSNEEIRTNIHSAYHNTPSDSSNGSPSSYHGYRTNKGSLGYDNSGIDRSSNETLDNTDNLRDPATNNIASTSDHHDNKAVESDSNTSVDQRI